jgi:hypothetical protein
LIVADGEVRACARQHLAHRAGGGGGRIEHRPVNPIV